MARHVSALSVGASACAERVAAESDAMMQVLHVAAAGNAILHHITNLLFFSSGGGWRRGAGGGVSSKAARARTLGRNKLDTRLSLTNHLPSSFLPTYTCAYLNTARRCLSPRAADASKIAPAHAHPTASNCNSKPGRCPRQPGTGLRRSVGSHPNEAPPPGHQQRGLRWQQRAPGPLPSCLVPGSPPSCLRARPVRNAQGHCCVHRGTAACSVRRTTGQEEREEDGPEFRLRRHGLLIARRPTGAFAKIDHDSARRGPAGASEPGVQVRASSGVR